MRHVHCWYCLTLTLIESYTDSYCNVYDLYGGTIHIKIALLSIYDTGNDISGPLMKINYVYVIWLKINHIIINLIKSRKNNWQKMIHYYFIIIKISCNKKNNTKYIIMFHESQIGWHIHPHHCLINIPWLVILLINEIKWFNCVANMMGS
jgi:hypothetical protein